MSNIYELSIEIQKLKGRLDDALDDALGEITDEVTGIEKELADTSMAFLAKADVYLKIRDELLGDAEKIQAHADRLAKRAAARGAAAARLKSWLEGAMIAQGLEKLKTETHSAYFQASQTVEILVPVEDLPTEWTRVKLEPKKAELGKALKAGERFVFAELQERKGLRIK